MPGPTHPAFLSLHTKLTRLEREIFNLDDFVRLAAVTPKAGRFDYSCALS